MSHSVLRSGACALSTALILLGLPAAGAAACTSTPASVRLADSLIDGEGLAPEATSIGVTIDGGCRATVDYAVINQASLLDDDLLGWFLDTDGSLATGAQSGFRGADHAVARAGGGATLTRFEPSTASWQVVSPALPSGPFGAQFDLYALAGYGSRTMTLAGGASWTSAGTGNTYFDWVPEIGALPMPFTVTLAAPAPPATPVPTVAPVPAPAPIPAAPAPAPAPAPTPAPPLATYDEGEDVCVVPRLKGQSLSTARVRIRKGGCKVGTIRKRSSATIKAGRVIQSNRYPGEYMPRGTALRLVVSTGKPARRARASSGSPTAASIAEALTAATDARP